MVSYSMLSPLRHLCWTVRLYIPIRIQIITNGRARVALDICTWQQSDRKGGRKEGHHFLAQSSLSRTRHRSTRVESGGLRDSILRTPLSFNGNNLICQYKQTTTPRILCFRRHHHVCYCCSSTTYILPIS